MDDKPQEPELLGRLPAGDLDDYIFSMQPPAHDSEK